MAAEGARAETAAEMLRVLHLPSPIAPAHGAFAALTQRLSAGRGDASDATRQHIARLQGELADANRRVQELKATREWRETGAVIERSWRLADALNDLLASVDRYELRVANALWADRDCLLVPDCVATLERHYGIGSVTRLDFAGDAEGARRRINDWVEEQTEQRIRDLIPAGAITPLIRVVIGNAVFFRGQWAAPFDAEETRDEDFTLANGERIEVRLMHEARRERVPYAAFDGGGSYFETPTEVPRDEKRWPPTYPDAAGFTLIELPYKGGDLAMTVLAPRSPGGLAHLEEMLSASTLAHWLGRLRPRTVTTAMLRFEQTAALELCDVLRDLGMRRAFVSPVEPGGAQFGGISAETDPARQLHLGGVWHKAWVAVDEKGTEAAAATAGLEPKAAAAPMDTVPFVPEFRANRPFLFAIRDTRSGAVLFLGRIVDPRSAGG